MAVELKSGALRVGFRSTTDWMVSLYICNNLLKRWGNKRSKKKNFHLFILIGNIKKNNANISSFMKMPLFFFKKNATRKKTNYESRERTLKTGIFEWKIHKAKKEIWLKKCTCRSYCAEIWLHEKSEHTRKKENIFFFNKPHRASTVLLM